MKGLPIRIGYVVSLEGAELKLADSMIYKNSVSAISLTDVVNRTGVALALRDKILYREIKTSGERKQIIIERILAHNIPTAPDSKSLLSQLEIVVHLPNEDVTRFENTISESTGAQIRMGQGENPDIIVTTTDDSGTRYCPDLLSTEIDLTSGLPLAVEVPSVSDHTLTYIHRISETTESDEILRARLFSFRFLHLLYQSIGYGEHIENWESLLDNIKAKDCGDPSGVVREDPCFMSWEGLHILAAEYARFLGREVESLICNQCKGKFRPMNFEDLKTLTRAISLPLGHKRSDSSPSPFGYHVMYVLKSSSSGVLLGGAPLVQPYVVDVNNQTEALSISEAVAQGKCLRVPMSMWGDNPLPKGGDKVLIEISESLDFETEERSLDSVRVVQTISKNHRVNHSGSFLARLGLGGTRLTVRIKYSEGVETEELKHAAEFVERLSGWKVRLDKRQDQALSSHVIAIAGLNKAILEARDSKTHKEAVRALQDRIDGISPAIRDVEDRPNVIVMVLPALQGIPMTTAGDMAQGVTKWGLYSLMFMPAEFGPVQLYSEACAGCPKSYAKGKACGYSSLVAILIIHEVLHVTADLKDHRGECRLCWYNRPEMKPLRFDYCEPCIQDDGNFVHRNCVMSYACQFCIAARLAEAGTLKDLLCEQCRRRIPEESLILSSYYSRVNRILAQSLITETMLKSKGP
ncbi:MAG: hypothetical protein JRN17_01560 [Nitrososphaerota archaeon]|nr:hypothetical protein [Nitrososphaerota archaeon]